METQSLSLADLKTPQEVQAERAHVFPSKSSFDWALRVHRDRLLKAGALRKVAGRIFLVPALFDACLLEAGRESVQGARHG